MSKYTFTKDRDTSNYFDISKVVIEVETELLDDLVLEFAKFLKASGFHDKGVDVLLNLVDEE